MYRLGTLVVPERVGYPLLEVKEPPLSNVMNGVVGCPVVIAVFTVMEVFDNKTRLVAGAPFVSLYASRVYVPSGNIQYEIGDVHWPLTTARCCQVLKAQSLPFASIKLRVTCGVPIAVPVMTGYETVCVVGLVIVIDVPAAAVFVVVVVVVVFAAVHAILSFVFGPTRP